LPGHFQAANRTEAIDNANNALGKGFAVVTSGLHVLGNQVNTTLSAEGALTLKSHFVVSYGPIRYTFSDGSSGGSIQQYGIGNSYPGLLDGLIASGTSFPDMWGVSTESADCRLLQNYFGVISPALWPTDAQKAAVIGTVDLSLALIDHELSASATIFTLLGLT
jgi:hypothetical protein